MVEVIINGVNIDLISEGVEYTRQVNDLADISTVNASFTYSLRADKTPKNTKLFQQLGMVGDTSKTAYVLNTAQLIDNASVLIEKGIAIIKETNDEYKLLIMDGVAEVFKLIENKTIGGDLDLSELDHSKTALDIIDSWNNNLPYRYLIADYNGKTNDGDNIDVQYQIPSVNVKYLWDKIFDYIGYTYSGDFSFIEDKWITYPKPPDIEEVDIETYFSAILNDYSGDYNNNYKSWTTQDIQPLTDVTLINNWRVKILQTGNYKLSFGGIGAMLYRVEGRILSFLDKFKINLLVNGQVSNFEISNEEGELKEVNKILQADDLVELEIAPLSVTEITSVTLTESQKVNYENGKYEIITLVIDTLSFQIDNIGVESISFSDELNKFKIKDFFKEVLFRGGLTPYTDNIQKHIYFDSLKERLDTSNYSDISKYFVRRTNEFYVYDNYAQRNYLSFKYNNEDEDHNDSYIEVVNKNIQAENDLFKSKFYTADKEPVTLIYGVGKKYLSPLLRMWEKEIKEDTNGNQVIEYKPLNNRFYYVSSELVNDSITVNAETSNIFYRATIKGTTMQEVVSSKFSRINKIFTDTRIHEIELALSAYQFKTLDLRKVQYLEQEGQFYILNKVKWKTGELSKGEFLRVKQI